MSAPTPDGLTGFISGLPTAATRTTAGCFRRDVTAAIREQLNRHCAIGGMNDDDRRLAMALQDFLNPRCEGVNASISRAINGDL